MVSAPITFLRLPLREKVQFLEIFLWLILSELMIRLLPFRTLKQVLGTMGHKTARRENEEMQRTAYRAGIKIRLVASRLPWECKCFAKSIAGRLFLKRRKIPATLYIGVNSNEEKSTGIGAHAWLRTGEIYVTGGRGEEDYTVMSYYG